VDIEGARVAPNTFRAYSNLFFDYVSLDRLEDAKSTLDEARARKLDQSLLPNYYQLAFLHSDAPEMERVLTAGMGSGSETTLLFCHSDTEAFHGRLKSARALSSRAVDSAIRDGAEETAAGWLASEALREAEFGFATGVREKVAKALARSSTKDVQVVAALALARAGDLSRAQAIADSLRKRFPTHTLINNYWLPTIQAAITLHGNVAAAARDNCRSQGHELGVAD
jgi:hypothetical protein